MLTEWFNEKFVAPLCHYYTPEATIIYGLILCLFVYGAYKLLNKLKIKINSKLLIGLLPFIIYGGWTRALRDHNIIYNGWTWCSPIYFAIFIITVILLVISVLIGKKIKISYHKILFSFGVALLIFNALFTTISNINGFLVVLALLIFWSAVMLGIHKIKPKILSLENAGIMIAHLLDASSTYTALTFFGYSEQHVLPNFLINIFGPVVMFPLKIIVVFFVLYILDNHCEDKSLRNFIKIVVLILGLALGVRDWLTLSM